MVVYQVLERAYQPELMVLIVVITISTILYAISGYLKAVVLCFKLKGPPATPFIGNILAINDKDMLEKYVKPAEAIYGRLIRIWVLIFPFFAITDPEDLQTVLSSRKHTEKIFFYKLLHNFLGNGLITSSAEKWNLHRRLIQPTFHVTTLDQFLGTFIDASTVLVERLKNGENQLNITPLINQCVIDILNESVLGVPVLKKSGFNMENSPFRQGKVVMPLRIVKPWLLLDWIYKMTETASAELNQKRKLDEFTKKMINIRRDALNRGEIPQRKCLLDFMLEISKNNPQFTDDDIVNEACTFMLAGQDSVGAATAFCLFLLATHPECQQKCMDELNEIFNDDNRVPTMKDIREMRYLEQCIKETLRLYPSVPLIARKVTEDFRCGKYTIPSGSNILIFPYATHRLSSIYPNPEHFDPERFSPKQCENRHPYAFIPFSAGPRNCIGYKFAFIEIKTVISTILREFELLPVEGKTKINPIFRITIRASGGLHVQLKSRKFPSNT
ncbi:probable cytochrome P450 4aa1 [Contarinia nasturtii]|uniref:probable cytochrome P450 4aa1 n=1 Tax=Contarinia nasturtii TaxID=265458 RepID=UPI0012D37B20|nr:probable cytochrome P450 4aa1 [Contarinia nasturtii]